MNAKKIIIAGGSGSLGKILVRQLKEYDFVLLSREKKNDENKNVSNISWDGKTIGAWKGELENAAAVINLSGRSVDCRYNKKNKKEIYASRLDSTRAIGNAILQCKNPPALWINAASATIYRHAEDRDMDEISGEIGSGFSVDVCQKWEAAANEFHLPATRRVIMRLAMVLARDGGVMGPMVKMTKYGLGGTMGNGKQYMSWLHEDDFAGIISFFLANKNAGANYNCCAPNPVPNKIFMQKLREACGKKFGLPAAEWMLQFGAFFIGTEADILLKSRRVVPKRLLDEGYKFHFPEVGAALKNLVGENNNP